MEEFVELKEMLMNRTLERMALYWDESTLSSFPSLCHYGHDSEFPAGERERECSGKEQDILTDSPLTLCLMSPGN